MFKPTKKQHVVNKAYVDQNGSGIDPFKVTITGIYDESTDAYTYTCDKSYGEINDWWNGLLSSSEHKPCIIKADDGTDRGTYYGRVMPYAGSNGTVGYLFIIEESDFINMFIQPPVYTNYINGYSLVPDYETQTDVVELVNGSFSVEFQPQAD